MSEKFSSVAIRLVFHIKFYMVSLFEEKNRSFNLQRASLYELKSFMRSVHNKVALNHVNSCFDSLAITIIIMIVAVEKITP